MSTVLTRCVRTLGGGVLPLVLVLVSVLSIAPRPAKAETLSVIPPRFELFGDPGTTIVEQMKVRNDSDVEETYTVQTENFTASGETGDVSFSDSDNKSFSLAQWITTDPTRFTVPARGEKIVKIAIRIPKDGEPGGHYASVLVKRGAQTAPGVTAVETRVGTLILLRVSGDVTEKAEISSFTTQESIAQYGPVVFQLRIKNDGNVHVAPTGTIVVNNIFGKKVTEIPLTKANVLPDATRMTTTTWDTKNLIGRYTATLVAKYGQNDQNNLTATTSFIIFPLYLLWTILGIIAAIALAITQRKRIKKMINRLTSD